MVMAAIHKVELENIKREGPGEVIVVESSRGVYSGFPYTEVRVNFRDLNRVVELRVFEIPEGQGVQLPLV